MAHRMRNGIPYLGHSAQGQNQRDTLYEEHPIADTNRPLASPGSVSYTHLRAHET